MAVARRHDQPGTENPTPLMMAAARIAWWDAGGTPEPARRLAADLRLPTAPGPDADWDLLLRSGPDGLALLLPGQPRLSPLQVDFGAHALQRRRGRGELLTRAVGCHKGTLRVIDATAGLGRDAFLLAACGCEVRLLEAHPVVHALLADGLRRAAAHDDLAPIVARMHLERADARQRLTDSDVTADAVYLDPMYPQRPKRARSGREMQYFQALLERTGDEGTLLQAARAAARRRVVVKRSRKAPPLAGQAPSFTLSGRSTRFDVYLVVSSHPAREPQA